MKTRIFSLAFAALIFSVASAEATSCQRRAQNCINNGGTHGACFEPSRMASCYATGVYTAPSGRTWEASDRRGAKQKK